MIESMKMHKVKLDQLETDEEDFFLNAYYQGKLFTGIAYYNENNIYSEWTYMNGFCHGRCFTVYDNGQLLEELYVEHGETLSWKEWNKDGGLLSNYQKEPYLKQKYVDDILILEITKEYKKKWYPTGEIKQEYLLRQGLSTYYAKDGIWVVKHHASEDGDFIIDRKYLEFNDEYILAHYMELLEDKTGFTTTLSDGFQKTEVRN